jgi:hypothetical protein
MVCAVKSSARAIMPVLLAAMAGYAQDTHYNYDRNADFGKYKTYRWVEIDGAIHLDQLTEKLLKNAFDTELSTKRLIQIMGNDPDLLISYQAAINHEEQFNAFSGGFGPGWGYGVGWGSGWGYANYPETSTITVQSTTIHIGSVGFDMYDADQKKLVWRGVAKLLKNYPPQPKQ